MFQAFILQLMISFISATLNFYGILQAANVFIA